MNQDRCRATTRGGGRLTSRDDALEADQLSELVAPKCPWRRVVVAERTLEADEERLLLERFCHPVTRRIDGHVLQGRVRRRKPCRRFLHQSVLRDTASANHNSGV